MSDGNGHPYSWSAIFNGYNFNAMENCGFKAIPDYLIKQSWPDDTIPNAKVTHIWTQDDALSKHIALSTYIANVAEQPENMIGQVDGILLARDDAANHLSFAAPFIDAGLPIYIDKPIALSLYDLDTIYARQKYPGQIFTCSALSYAKEFQVDDIKTLGSLRHIYASGPKDWDKYAVHLIEPMLHICAEQGELARSMVWREDDIISLHLLWDTGFQATVSTMGDSYCPFSLRLFGENGWRDLLFTDTFYAFKAALSDFVNGIIKKDVRTDPRFVRRVVDVIERGRAE